MINGNMPTVWSGVVAVVNPKGRVGRALQLSTKKFQNKIGEIMDPPLYSTCTSNWLSPNDF